VITVKVYEDSEPPTLAASVGKMYGLNDGQIKKLAGTIEKGLHKTFVAH
jgi:hypothetical protein